MHSALSVLNTISSYAVNGYVRYPVLVEGSISWCEKFIESYLQNPFSELKRIELYGDLNIEGLSAYPIKSALKKLGQETDCLIIDISNEFNANAINAICGTLVGGGIVFFIQSSNSTLPSHVYEWLSLFKKKMVCISEDEYLYALPDKPELKSANSMVDSLIYRSQDQELAVQAIKKVVTGHTKRPLVMTADRGRGKSSAIGIAIAELTKSRTLTIGITAPQRASVDEIFSRAASTAILNKIDVNSHKNSLTMNDSNIIYIAPDELLKGDHSFDLLCVDEAAAIPASMLMALSEKYTRILFSTTINGYEGTGRGFEIKFKKQLQLLRPNYRSIEMKQPIRWNINDPLESWLSSVFLLNHTNDVSDSALDIDMAPSLSIDYRQLSIVELLGDALLAQSLFSLLVSAHYQTSPNDWFSLLSDPTLSCWIGIDKNSKRLLCCALVSKEGGLDSSLIHDIQYGKRRPKGHLAPVSLTQTLCIDEPAAQCSIRIMRIAVAVGYQHYGIGTQFMKFIESSYLKTSVDYLSTSFGSVTELNNFWNSLGFTFVRLGISKDKASGTHSLLAIKPLNKISENWLPVATDYFSASFPEQLMSTFSDLNVNEVLSLLGGISNIEPINVLMLKRLTIFIHGGLGFELIQYELRKFVLANVAAVSLLSLEQKSVIVTKVIQVRSWQEVISKCNLVGRKSAEKKLRESIKVLMHNLQCKS